MTEKKKFDINTFNIDESSQESNFNVDEPAIDVVDNFKSIGEEYAGTGLSSKHPSTSI